MVGLENNTVKLCCYKKEWEQNAAETIAILKSIFGSCAKDIQHVGSTAIKNIKAKPIIDIAVAVDSFENVKSLLLILRQNGFFYRPDDNTPSQMLFACGDYYTGGEMQTHFIHVVLADSKEWNDYLNFKDYLNEYPKKAKDYEEIKEKLATCFPNDRDAYTHGKSEFISFTLRKALNNKYLGKIVTVEMDRPMGYVHKKENYTLVYPINYGYIPGVIGGDGEELDVYVIGVDKPIDEFTGRIIAVIHRENDNEDKLVAAADGKYFSEIEIRNAVNFQEQYYKSHIEMMKI